jgi:hypothetical protein
MKKHRDMDCADCVHSSVACETPNLASLSLVRSVIGAREFFGEATKVAVGRWLWAPAIEFPRGDVSEPLED